jgi:hypothetical protein
VLFVERIVQHTGKAVDVRKYHLRDNLIVGEIREVRSGENGACIAIVVCVRRELRFADSCFFIEEKCHV